MRRLLGLDIKHTDRSAFMFHGIDHNPSKRLAGLGLAQWMRLVVCLVFVAVTIMHNTHVEAAAPLQIMQIAGTADCDHDGPSKTGCADHGGHAALCGSGGTCVPLALLPSLIVAFGADEFLGSPAPDRFLTQSIISRHFRPPQTTTLA